MTQETRRPARGQFSPGPQGPVPSMPDMEEKLQLDDTARAILEVTARAWSLPRSRTAKHGQPERR